MSEEQRVVTVTCRYFASCQYSACGPEDDIRSNYRVHLKEEHRIKHPRVEENEVTQDSSLLELVTREKLK